MRRALYFAMSILMILSAVGCKSAKLESIILEQSLVIDGYDEEWKDAPFIYFDDANISAKVSNDEQYLYVFLRFTDRQIADRMQRFGITCYLSPRGKKNEDFRIKFRNDQFAGRMQGMNRDEMRTMRSGYGGDMGGPDFNMDLPAFGNLSAVEFLNEIPLEVYPLINDDGPMCAFMVENGIKNYEFRIPLRMAGDDYEELNLAQEEIIGFGFAIGKPDLEAMGDRMGGAGMGGMTPGGGGKGGGRGGGGMGGGRGGGMGRGGMDMHDDMKLWMKITLAK